ncbi:MAG: M48 family metallopeptidase [Planctomycetota bacterium]
MQLRKRLRRACFAGLLLISPSCQALSNFNLFPPAQDVEMGLQAYDEVLANERVINSGAQVTMVREIMDRLVQAARVEKPDLVDLFQWEVKLLDNDGTVNAFCLPGGKMAVYTGILPVAETDAGLAVVMGHEIAHALERHGTEAVTRQMGISVVLQILSGGDPDQMSVLASNLLSLRFGRGAELEADASGLRYMARAGYDPREASAFWRRMAALGGGAPPEWLSTHPSNENRISQIEDLLPEALDLYEQAIGAPAPPPPAGTGDAPKKSIGGTLPR